MDLGPIIVGNEIQNIKLLKGIWSIYREYFLQILLLTLINYIPGFLGLLFPAKEFSLFLAVTGIIISGVFFMLSVMAISIFTEEAVGGRSPEIAAALKKAFARLPACYATGLLLAIVLFCWYLLLIIPGVIKSVRYSFSFQAVALRNKGNFAALFYSRKVVDDYWWSVVSADVVLGLPKIIIGLPFTLATWYVMFHSGTWYDVQNYHHDLMQIKPIIGCLAILATGFFFVGATLLFLALERIKERVDCAPANVVDA